MEPLGVDHASATDPSAWPRIRPLLIVGHTEPTSTRIWLRGGTGHHSVRVELHPGEAGAEVPPAQTLTLHSWKDFTATAPFERLTPGKRYEVIARFRRTPRALDSLRSEASGTEVRGELRTFPERACDEAFSFLLASCNLSVVSLTNFGGLVAGGLGMLAAQGALVGSADPRFRIYRWVRPVLAPMLRAVLKLGFLATYWTTHFEQPSPLLTSPFAGLLDRPTPTGKPAAFAIHAGDQIYFDVPYPRRKPTVGEYRRSYRQTWSEDEGARSFLSRCPQYMILDDHEIVDSFATDFLPPWLAGGEPDGVRSRVWDQLRHLVGRGRDHRDPKYYLERAARVYRDYVHARHPSRKPSNRDGPFDYAFDYGVCGFFVLDTRTERKRHQGLMIGEEQLQRLKRWLREEPHQLKFVVSSVAFLAELRSRRASPVRGNGQQVPSEEIPDKWSDEPYRRQRDEIVEALYEHGNGRVVFLVGDMHCSYQATMRVGEPGRRVTLHELASSPIHQLDLPSPADFQEHHYGTTSHERAIPFTTRMRRIHAAASNVVRVTVQPRSGELIWEVLHTRVGLAIPGDTRRTALPERTRTDRTVAGDTREPPRGSILLGAP